MRRVPGWTPLLAAMFLLPGCVQEGRLATEPFRVDVPAWRAGHSWTYDVTERDTGEIRGSDRLQVPPSAPQSHSETLTVFNTTHTLDGAPAYYAWIDRHDGSDVRILDDYRPVQAYRQSDLARVATGSLFVGDGQCLADCNHVRLTDAAAQAPKLEFPLEPGKEWTTRTSGGDSPGLEVDYRVAGRWPVDVGPEGPTSAVVVHATGALLDEKAARRAILEELAPPGLRLDRVDAEFRFGADYYWGEGAKNLIHARESYRLEFHLRGVDEQERAVEIQGFLGEEVVRTLTSVDLAERPETRVPPVTVEGLADADLEVVQRLTLQDHGLRESPPNVATGPVLARFELLDPTRPTIHWHGGGEPAKPTPPIEPFNASRFEAHWELRHEPAGPLIETARGPSFEATLFMSGSFRVDVTLHDHVFDADVRTLSLGFSVVYRAARYTEGDTGLGYETHLLSFPVEADDAQVLLDWSVVPDNPTGEDADVGEYRLVGPSGTLRTFPDGSGNFYADGLALGTYTLVWKPKTPVVVGDDHVATVLVTFPTYAPHHHL